MDLLIIGGTVFLGKHLAAAAHARGHNLTLFNRGKSRPDAFPEVKQIHGDRDGGIDALRGRTWDAVIDTCGYVPRVVRQSATLLASAVGHYTFISSISAVGGFPTPGIDETAPDATMKDETVETVDGDTYGPLKVLCEREVESAYQGRALIVRPGLIVGPDDPSDRFTYWPCRAARGGEVLAPGDGSSLIQIIDVRDLAEWTIRLVEQRVAGRFHATGPAERLTMRELVDTCLDVAQSSATVTWADEAFLAEANVQSWSDLPVWVAENDTPYRYLTQVSVRKAVDAGLTFRPLEDTVRDTLAWARTRPADYTSSGGLTPEREAEVLTAWHARGG